MQVRRYYQQKNSGSGSGGFAIHQHCVFAFFMLIFGFKILIINILGL